MGSTKNVNSVMTAVAFVLVAVAVIRVNCGCCGFGFLKEKTRLRSAFWKAIMEGMPGSRKMSRTERSKKIRQVTVRV